jgi:hypothetical protein
MPSSNEVSPAPVQIAVADTTTEFRSSREAESARTNWMIEPADAEVPVCGCSLTLRLPVSSEERDTPLTIAASGTVSSIGMPIKLTLKALADIV